MKNDDSGFTLLETLAALMIMGICVTVIAGGMALSVFASNRHHEQSAANVILLQAVENVKSSAVPLVPCVTAANADTYRDAARGVGASPDIDFPVGFSAEGITIVDVDYDDGTGFSEDICDALRPGDRFPLVLQLITVQVADPRGGDRERLTFVKGRSG